MIGNFRDELGITFETVGERYPGLCVVTADVSKSTRSIRFKERWPERFFTVGIAEADAVGIAAGIASFNRPVIFTAYSMFATGKPFEQIRNCLCYPNLNVKIVATHGGISVGEDGVTHQMTEDIAIMRAIPNMKVLVAADPGEVQAAVLAALETPGPVYVRLGRSVGRALHEDRDLVSFKTGEAEVRRSGQDVCIMAAGIMVEQALLAAKLLAEENIEAGVVNLRSIKPLDVETVTAQARLSGAVVTAEDHNVCGGVFGAVCEVLASRCPVPVQPVAVMDTFAESGKGDLLLAKYGLTAEEIVKKARLAVAQKSRA